MVLNMKILWVCISTCGRQLDIVLIPVSLESTVLCDPLPSTVWLDLRLVSGNGIHHKWWDVPSVTRCLQNTVTSIFHFLSLSLVFALFKRLLMNPSWRGPYITRELRMASWPTTSKELEAPHSTILEEPNSAALVSYCHINKLSPT